MCTERRRLGLICALFLSALLLTGCARPTEAASKVQAADEGARAAARLRVLPWIEVNLDTAEFLEHAAQGLARWSGVVDTVIVTTTVGRTSIYAELQRRVPGLKLIPGVKTAGYCDPFDSLTGWRTIANEVGLACAITGARQFVLENETALHDEEGGGSNSFWDARVELDWVRLRRCLEQLPSGIEYWWAPSFVTGGNQSVRHRQSERLCRLVEEICEVRFIDGELAKPPARNDGWNDEIARIAERVAERPRIPIIYFYYNDRFWRVDQLGEALAHVRGDTAIIYFGWAPWVEGSGTLSRELKRLRESPATRPGRGGA